MTDGNPFENRLLGVLDRQRRKPPPRPPLRWSPADRHDPRHLAIRPRPAIKDLPAMLTIVAKSLKVTVVLPAEALAALHVPEGEPRFLLTIRVGDASYTADLNSKSARKAIARALRLRRDCAGEAGRRAAP
jgi:hypothetical protein